jgi:hypothetical protein
MIIVQIGCHNGNDHVFTFCADNKDKIEKIILVDANNEVKETVMDRYTGFTRYFMNAAIVTDRKENSVLIAMPKDRSFSDHASLSSDHLRAHGHEEIELKAVQALMLRDVFIHFGLVKIDRLYIDIEGLDVPVLTDFDFTEFDIPYLQFEKLHSDGPHTGGGEKLDYLVERLSMLGYSVEHHLWDIIAQKKCQQ